MTDGDSTNKYKTARLTSMRSSPPLQSEGTMSTSGTLEVAWNEDHGKEIDLGQSVSAGSPIILKYGFKFTIYICIYT